MTPEMEIAEETARIRAWRVNLTSISHELANQSATNLRVNLTEAETARHPETDSSLSVFDLGSRASPKSRKSTEAETDTSVGQGGQGSPGYDSPLRCGGGGDAGAVAAGAGAPASSVSSASTSSPPPAAAGPHPHVPGNLHGWPGGALTSERVGEIESQVGEGVGVGGGGEPVERHRKGEEAEEEEARRRRTLTWGMGRRLLRYEEEAGGVMEEVVKGARLTSPKTKSSS